MQISVSQTLLCTPQGRIIASAHHRDQNSGEIMIADTTTATLTELSQQLPCPQLSSAFSEFVNSTAAAQKISLPVREQLCQMHLRRLNAEAGEPLFLLELEVAKEKSSVEASAIVNSHSSPPEIGSLAGRLLHDFKNQISGLKLYASWLKKHCATAPGNSGQVDFAEILDKMINGLNVMAEHAHLITRLSQPLALKLAPASLDSLLNQLADETVGQATARNIGLSIAPPPEMLSLNCDAQLLFSALRAITLRALSACRIGGQVSLNLQYRNHEIFAAIADDSPELLTDEQQATFFDLPVRERLTTTMLGLALARRIIEQHGGQVTVTSAPEVGNVVTVCLAVKPAALPKEHGL